MNVLGADVPALFNFARQLRDRMNKLEETRTRLTAILESVEWVGADREQFLGQWHQIHSPSLSTLVADLVGVSGDVEGHARRQELTSGGR